MKKLSKFTVLLLSAIMLLSVFTACSGSDNSTGETVLAGANLLIGNWEAAYIDEDYPISLLFTFNRDGTANTILAESCYDDIINKLVEAEMALITDESIDSEGFSSKQDAEKFVKEALIKEYPYETLSADYRFSCTWTLNGDTLTMQVEGGGTLTAETQLSRGNTTFTCKEMKFTKIT